MADDFEGRFEAEEDDPFAGRFEADEPSDPARDALTALSGADDAVGIAKSFNSGETDYRKNARTVLETGAGLASIPFTGGLGIAARLGVAGLAGAGGSLASEAVDPSEDVPQALGRAGVNAAASAAGEGLGTLAGAAIRGGADLAQRGARAVAGRARELAESAEPALRKFAGEQAASSAGIRGRLQVRRAGGAEAIPDLGNRLIDEGIVTAGSSTAKAGARADALKKTAGATVGGFEDQAAELGYGPRSSYLRGQLERVVSKYAPRNLESAAPLRRVVDTFKDDLAANVDDAGRVPPEVIKQLESQLDSQLRSLYGGSANLPSAATQIKKEMRLALKKAQEFSVDSLDPAAQGGVAKGEYKRAKGQYADAKRASRAATYQGEGATGGARGLPGTTFQAVREALVNPRARSAAAIGARKLADAIANRAIVRGATGASGDAAEVIPILDRARSQGTQALRAAAVVLATRYPELKEAIFEEVQAAPE